MDEKPNRFIMNNEEPLDDNGFSSIDNHQENIDNLDDSSKEVLQNDQDNQLNDNSDKNIDVIYKTDNKNISKINKQNMPKNTNPNMQNRMDMAKKQVGKNAVRGGLTAATGGAYEGIRKIPLVGGVAKKVEDKAGDKLSDKINKFRHPLKSRFGLFNKDKENKEDGSVDVISSAKKIGKIASIGGTILSALLPFIVLIIIIAALYAPIAKVADAVGTFFSDLGQRFVNLWNSGDFNTNAELEKEFNDKVDQIVAAYPEISREELVSLAYYSLTSPEEFLESLDKDSIDRNGNLSGKASEKRSEIFGKMKDRIASLANQMVYSTVIFSNDLIKVDDYNEKGKKIGHHYECPSGTTYSFRSNDTSFCNGEVAKDSYIKSPDLRSADTCIDRTYMREDDKTLKCIQITYETNTEKSKTKLENFLKYGKLADGDAGKIIKIATWAIGGYSGLSMYEDITQVLGGYYDWKDMVSKFSSIGGSNIYNIPAYKIGEGKENDNYSKLDNENQRTVDNKVRLINGMIELASGKTQKLKSYIKGNASLPLDFTIKGTAEETIKSRITSSFGNRMHPVYHEIRFHNGVDFSHITTSDPVYSLLDGVVVGTTNIYSGCGIGVLIGHDIDNDLKYDYYTRYCHFSSLKVSQGEVVYNGQQIGIMGTTGTSTGIHLHFEIQDANRTPIDPVPYLIDIVNKTSNLVSGPNSSNDLDGLEEEYNNKIAGKIKKRSGAVITAELSSDKLNTLPYFCGGYTNKLVDNSWYNDTLVTDVTCSNYNQNSKYGLDNLGYVSWILTLNGNIDRRYNIDELKSLGDNVDIFDNRVKEGDLAYKGNKIGIITNIGETEITVIYMDTTGLVLKKFNKNSLVFNKVILMDKVYE